MKKLIVSLFAVAALAVPAAAGAAPPPGGGWGPGGVPAAHGVAPGEWGPLVSSVAPGGFIGCHASGGKAATC
jgi:hypothetical protein